MVENDEIKKPTVFLGSSSEGLPYAEALQDALEPDLEVVPWNRGLFELGEDTLNSLLKFVSVFDFGIFVLSGDDLVKSRRFRSPAPRDNVIFELGLFMGALGRRRAFPVIAPPKKGRLKVPSDLLGNTELRLPAAARKNLDAKTLHEPVKQLKETIQTRAKESYLQLLPSTGLAVGYFKNFLVPVCSTLANLDHLDVAGETIDLTDDNFDFHVVLPASLAKANREGARRFVKDRGLLDLNLPTGGAGRSYPFYVGGECRDGRLQIYDYPTTLGASYQAIEIALANGFLGQTDHHRVLERKEIVNFQRTLEILLGQQPEAAELSDNIHFIQETKTAQ
tara:strand:+ start:7437 stop:8444 length:1008 start_codon:yes stop_codon:yes gene_type:complete